MMKGLAQPIIPAYVDKTCPHRITVMFGAPMPSTATTFEVRQKVLEIGSQVFRYRLELKETLHETFLRQARRRPFAPCISDMTGMKFNRLGTFVAARLVQAELRRLVGPEEFVGSFLPTSVMGVLANLAIGFLDKTPVNLNYTSSKEILSSSVEQSGLKVILSSHMFLERTKLTPPLPAIFIEDILAKASLTDRFLNGAMLFVPSFALLRKIVFGRWQRGDINALANLVFTSGSTGIPKGVMLTHTNIRANLEGFYQSISARRDDKLMGILPFFHSFGFTAVLWLPIVGGIEAIYHPSPLDAQVIGKLVREHRATFLMATPAFISAYIKRCQPDDFKTIRFTIIGAEKLKENIAQGFKEKFGFRPLEGYGCSELSPIVSLNFHDQIVKGKVQKAQKPGTIGPPLPGVAVRIVDPDTMRTLKENEPGLLLVKGALVMRGYLNKPQMTEDTFFEGWYKTGDIAFLDEDGFITITDRLSRFSKIAGEMIPHIRIEEALHTALGSSELVFAVCAVPDDRKGERLVVLRSQDIDVSRLCDALKAQGFPNLWIPDKDMFFKVDAIPTLGSGKLDLASIKKKSLEFTRIN
jgi:acyl-[acyl-carrier-protein]-phospholipid O-acyltransferase/long-chain-fatty-acid--[acyl-carrier-protein] ligase